MFPKQNTKMGVTVSGQQNLLLTTMGVESYSLKSGEITIKEMVLSILWALGAQSYGQTFWTRTPPNPVRGQTK